MAATTSLECRSDEHDITSEEPSSDSKPTSYMFLEIALNCEESIARLFISILSDDGGSISVEPLKHSFGSTWKSNRVIAWPEDFDTLKVQILSEVDSNIESFASINMIHSEVQQAFKSHVDYVLVVYHESNNNQNSQLIVSEVNLPPEVIEALDDPTAESKEILVLDMENEDDGGSELSAKSLSTSAGLLLRRFESTGKRADVDNSIILYESAISSFDPSSPGYFDCVYKAGIAYLERFGLLGSLEDIDSAILNFQEAVSAARNNSDADLPMILGDLSNAHFYRFERAGKSYDIDEAVTNQRRAIELTPTEHRFYLRRLNNLGVSLQRLFQYSGNMKDLEEGIELQKKVIELTPENNLRLLAKRLNNLVASIQSHFEGTGNLKDLEDAIPLQQRAIDLADDKDVDKAVYLSNLGNILRRKFNFGGNVDDINWAIDVQRKAVDHADSERDASYPSYLNNLANCFVCRYERLGNTDDLAEGIKMQRMAIEMKSQKHVEYARHHNNLGTSLIRWYEHTGEVEDINEAVSALRKAVKFLNLDKSSEYGTYLANLGTALQCRFEHTLHLDDIEEAIAVLQQGLNLVPESAANYINILESLGRAYQDRFERTGSLRDLDEAIELQQRAVNLTPESSPSLPGYLGNLGNTIWCRFLRTDDVSIIDRAIEVHQRAVDLTPEGHPDLPNHLHNLANSLRHRCEDSGTIENINSAIRIQKRAVALTSDDNPELSRRLETLGLLYRCRLDKTDADEDIEEAISIFRKVIQLTPEQHMSRWSKFNALAALLGRRFHGSGKQEHIEESISCYRSATMSVSGLPLNRIKTARRWAKTYLAYIGEKNSSRLLEAYKIAFQLLPQTVWLGYTIKGRHEQLKDIADLSNEAAAVAISSGELEKGLQWLEQGRCIVWSQLSSLRHPVDAVREKEPELAEDLLRVSMQLQAAGSRDEDEEATTNMMQKISIQAQVREHQKVAEEWQSLLERTRRIAGFESFLQPFSLANHDLSKLPGPVVVINVHLMRCDALVLDNKEPHLRYIPLPEFSVDNAQSLLKILNETFVNHNVRMRGARSGRMVRPLATPKGLKMILRELWTAVVKPILSTLGFMGDGNHYPTEKRRIWWCPTGLLTFLPLHAAGIYDIPGGPTCSDFVISSYIPNVSAIFEKLGRTSSSPRRLLAIGQSKSHAFPLLSELPNVMNEIEVIRQIFSSAQTEAKILTEDSVTVSSVLDIMSSYPYIHLACHASQEQNPPTKSGFYLNDGQLTLGELIQKSLPDAEFAFLSACQTSTGDQELSEEAVHLAAGMLSAGYKGVIATMWSISDEYAPVVAREVYSYLLEERNAVGGHASAAEALYHAIKCVRDEYGDDEMALLSWVPYIHMGV